MISRTQRRRLFYVLVLAFVVVGAATVLYSQGWRLDFTTLTLQKVGAIYIRSYPDSADITLDGQLVKNSSWLLQSGTLINGLFPNKTYKVSLTAAGYRPWNQTVTVHPALVAELAPAVLVPETARLASSTSPVQAYWIGSNGILFEQTADNLMLDGRRLPGAALVSHTKDFKVILTQDTLQKNYNIVQTDTGESISANLKLKRFGLDIKQVTRLAIDSEDGTKLIVYQPNRLSYLDTAAGKLTALEATSSPEYPLQSSRSLWAWTVRSGAVSILKIYDKFSDQQLANVPAFGTVIKKITWVSSGQLAVLQDDGRLYIYDPGSQTLKQIASDVRDFRFNAAGNLLAAVENGVLEVISLSEARDYWRFQIPDAGEISEIIWYFDGRHLFLRYPNYTAFLDVKDALQEHVYTFPNIEQPQYDADTNRLYFMQNEKLYELDFPKS